MKTSNKQVHNTKMLSSKHLKKLKDRIQHKNPSQSLLWVTVELRATVLCLMQSTVACEKAQSNIKQRLSVYFYSFVTIVDISSSVSFPSESTKTPHITYPFAVCSQCIRRWIEAVYLLNHFWRVSDLRSTMYNKPNTNSMPKKPPTTQPMRVTKLALLSGREDLRFLNLKFLNGMTSLCKI